jgi:hypothetical protein
MAAQQQSLMEKMCLHAVRRDETSRITAHDVYVLPVDPFHHLVLRNLDRTFVPTSARNFPSLNRGVVQETAADGRRCFRALISMGWLCLPQEEQEASCRRAGLFLWQERVVPASCRAGARQGGIADDGIQRGGE